MKGGRVITDVIEREELSAEEELGLLRTAREKVTVLGHSVPSAAAQNAKERLIGAYAGAINRYAKVPGLDWEELEQELIEAFLRAIEEYDFQSGNRLAHEIRFRFSVVVREYESKLPAFAIPSRTRARFYYILYAQADGSWSKALDLLEENRMTRETFVAINEALHGVQSLSHVDRLHETPVWNSGIPDWELVEFVRWLKSGLNERELLVINLHFGFDDDEANELRLRQGHDFQAALSIPQVASMMNSHQRTMWRVRESAIDKMRRMVNADGT